jgi:cytochrome oxidase Cu insertion factor (SCO1/SenC/PrrC family)
MLQVMLVGVEPERDIREADKSCLEQFAPWFSAVISTPNQLLALAHI